MQIRIMKEFPGHMRLGLAGRVPERDIDALITVAHQCMYVTKVRVYGRIAQMAVEYTPVEGARGSVIGHLCSIGPDDIEKARSEYAITLAPRAYRLFLNLANLIGAYFAKRWFLPAPIRAAFTVAAFLPFLKAGIDELLKGRLTVPVLDAALERVGLSAQARQLPHQLSGGERQRVAIARVLASRPDVVFADEPTAALDVAAGADVLDWLAQLRRNGTTVLMVTHDAAAAARARNVLVMDAGRIVAALPGGDPDAVSRAVLAARAGGRARAERRQEALR